MDQAQFVGATVVVDTLTEICVDWKIVTVTVLAMELVIDEVPALIVGFGSVLYMVSLWHESQPYTGTETYMVDDGTGPDVCVTVVGAIAAPL